MVMFNSGYILKGGNQESLLVHARVGEMKNPENV
jgi:hypothetical protein